MKDYGLPDFVNKLTPVVELAWSSPASRPSQDVTQYLWGVGVNYTTTNYAFGVEALIPGNRNTGSHVGVIAQFHLYFDDLLPQQPGQANRRVVLIAVRRSSADHAAACLFGQAAWAHAFLDKSFAGGGVGGVRDRRPP